MTYPGVGSLAGVSIVHDAIAPEPSSNPLWTWHRNRCYGGHTRYWTQPDSEQHFARNMEDPESRATLVKLGWDQPGCITYRYNSHGFRDEEFDDRPCGLAFGCSITEGVGIDQASTWPARLTHLMGIHVWNLGVGGTGMDTVYRLFDHYINLLRPRFVAVACPPWVRFEYVLSDQEIRTVSPQFNQTNEPLDAYFKQYFSNDLNSATNFHKNLRLLRLAAAERGLPFAWGYAMTDCMARDLRHPGRNWQDNFAQSMARQLQAK